MTVNELNQKLKELQDKDLGEHGIKLSSFNEISFEWRFFELSDVGYSDKVVVININEN